MSHPEIPWYWLVIGFSGQAVFTARFLVQWIASERRGQSYIPLSFWYLSLLGSWMLLAYAIYRRDPVIITGQLFGVVVYGRNLALLGRRQASAVAAPSSEEASVMELPTAPALRRAG